MQKALILGSIWQHYIRNNFETFLKLTHSAQKTTDQRQLFRRPKPSSILTFGPTICGEKVDFFCNPASGPGFIAKRR
jgi:hypothetical protein